MERMADFGIQTTARRNNGVRLIFTLKNAGFAGEYSYVMCRDERQMYGVVGIGTYVWSCSR